MTEKDLLVAVVTAPAGFAIDLFDLLILRRLEGGRFAVAEQPAAGMAPTTEVEFADAAAAVAHFLERRHTRQLGYDYET